jgi:hypothetical protein
MKPWVSANPRANAKEKINPVEKNREPKPNSEKNQGKKKKKARARQALVES